MKQTNEECAGIAVGRTQYVINDYTVIRVAQKTTMINIRRCPIGEHYYGTAYYLKYRSRRCWPQTRVGWT